MDRAGPTPSASTHWALHHQHSTSGAHDSWRESQREGESGAGVGSRLAPPPHPSYNPPRESIWGLNKHAPLPPSSPAAPPDQPRLAYEAQDPDYEDGHPRPPVPIYRANEISSQGIKGQRPPSRSHPTYAPLSQAPSSSSVEAERSYMYAPASIRNRLAAMRKGPASPPPPTSHRGLETPASSAPYHHHHHHHPASPYAPQPPPPHHDGFAVGPPPTHWHDPRAFPPMSREYQAAAAADMDDDRRNSLEGPNKYKKRSRAPAPSSCKNCGTNETPEWRRGPDGARTLCNACGLHFAKMVKKRGPHADGPTGLPDDELPPYHGGAPPPANMLPPPSSMGAPALVHPSASGPPPPGPLHHPHHPAHLPHEARMLYASDGAAGGSAPPLRPGSSGHHHR
ncbi:hypothetical protein BDZ90DRAFT_230250 [Jaminaea rosea]|uniref:GATA-type domain-containing protein n=1 Tax=Jaminaea rosea TaxID=1569628 RepID=A0A316UZM0_9BASI|nr:hypothetical protein BDZ90DRAFT_230250 [Jaminaea rosea]PWN29373.1 hypothetical protein BDZ90DRAFT_230250 [Jaminaea rosea]